jgi:hypothetical protein
MLACGSIHLTNFQITMILLVLAAVASLPIVAIANLVLAGSVDRERVPLHVALFGVYAIPGVIGWNHHDQWSFENQMVCCIVMANLIFAQFAFLSFKAWRQFRARRRERAEGRQMAPQEMPVPVLGAWPAMKRLPLELFHVRSVAGPSRTFAS